MVLVKGFAAWFGLLVGQLAGMLSPSRCAVPISGTWRRSWTCVRLCSCRPCDVLWLVGLQRSVEGEVGHNGNVDCPVVLSVGKP